MRVLLLKGLSMWALGGDRTETLRLVRGAADRGCEVALAADALPKELAGVAHYKIDYPQTPAVQSQVRAAVDAFRPDVVHVIGAGVRFLEAFDRALRGGPWAFTAHNVPPAERTLRRLFARPACTTPPATRWRCRASALVAVPRARVVRRRRLPQRDRPPPPRRPRLRPGEGHQHPVRLRRARADATTSPVPVPPARAHRDRRRLRPAQGPARRVRAVARLLPRFPHLAYRMIGNPRPNERFARFIAAEVERLGLSRNAALLETHRRRRSTPRSRDADLYLQPSHEEGFCIAFMEAAMVAPRVVGTRHRRHAGDRGGRPTARVVPTRGRRALARRHGRVCCGLPATADALEWRREDLRRRYSWADYAAAVGVYGRSATAQLAYP
jgi:hypothetical protein